MFTELLLNEVHVRTDTEGYFALLGMRVSCSKFKDTKLYDTNLLCSFSRQGEEMIPLEDNASLSVTSKVKHCPDLTVSCPGS